MSLENTKQWPNIKKDSLSWKTKLLIWWVVLSVSALISWCWSDSKPLSPEQISLNKWEEVLVSKIDWFELYTMKPFKTSDYTLYYTKYNPNWDTVWWKISENKPEKIWENTTSETYVWRPYKWWFNVYIVKWKESIHTTWKDSVWRNPKTHITSYQYWGNVTEKKVALTDENLKEKRNKTIMALTDEQRNNLWLTEEYNQLLQQIKK